MHEEEEHDEHRADKVDRPCGRASSEDVNQPWPSRIHCWGHGQPSQDLEGNEDEDDAEIGQLLKRVVSSRHFALRKAQQRMVLKVFQEMTRGQFAPAGKQVLPDVPVDETEDPVGDDRRHEQPRKGQVPVARQCEVVS